MSEGFAGGREIRDTYLPFYFRTGSSFSLPTPGFNNPTGGGGGVTYDLASYLFQGKLQFQQIYVSKAAVPAVYIYVYL